jgi:alpha-N-arabinofuranosidase
LIDRVVLNPADAVDGLDPEIIELSKAWPVPLLRYPGGNFVSFYHWRDGVGPVDLRPTYPNHAWGGLEYGLFGTDEFITFCRHIGADGQRGHGHAGRSRRLGRILQW